MNKIVNINIPGYALVLAALVLVLGLGLGTTQATGRFNLPLSWILKPSGISVDADNDGIIDNSDQLDSKDYTWFGIGNVLDNATDAGSSTITNVKSPTATSAVATKGYVDENAGAAWTNQCDAYPDNATYTYETLCTPGNKDTDDSCPYWQDCDGDGHYWHPAMATTTSKIDCDENCADCYKGSTKTTTSPDGRDQDCDGVIDEEASVGVGPYFLYTTATDTTGNLGGRSGADNMCNTDSNKPSECVKDAWAFISLSDSDEIKDMPTTIGVQTNLTWYGPDGTTKMADNWSDLLDGSVDNNPLTQDYWWTGDDGYGGSQNQDCNDFTSSDGGTYSHYGLNGETGTGWLNNSHIACDDNRPGVLCACGTRIGYQ